MKNEFFNGKVITMNSSLHKILEEYVVDKTNAACSQHSPEWYIERQDYVGGSSISAFYDVGKKTLCEFIEDKIFNRQPDCKPILLQWGTLFEPVICNYTERKHNCKIIGENLFIKHDDIIAYSPDGLAVVKVEIGQTNTYENIYEDRIVLFEFKCPITRPLFGRGRQYTMPGYYIPQIKLGREVIPIASCAIFSEGSFRRCQWDDLDFNSNHDITYLKMLDSKLTSTGVGKYVTAIGTIGFYAKSRVVEDELPTLYEKFFNIYTEFTLNDLGCCDPDLFCDIMDGFSNGKIEVKYYPVIMRYDRDYKEKLNNYLVDLLKIGETNDIIGMLPWKLFNTRETLVHRDEKFLEPIYPKIRETMQFIRECRNLPTESHSTAIHEYLVKINTLN